MMSSQTPENTGLSSSARTETRTSRTLRWWRSTTTSHVETDSISEETPLLGEALVDAEGNVEVSVPIIPEHDETMEDMGDDDASVSDESVSATASNDTTAETTENQNLDDSTVVEDDNNNPSATVTHLTRRLRCMFSAVTWPIVPLGTLVLLTLVWLLYCASVVEVGNTCSKPLHQFAFGSFALVIYSIYHSHVRFFLFRYSRERDGPMRPAGVRLYDQLFHTICILYVYGGVSLIQNCQRDSSDEAMAEAMSEQPSGDLLKTATATNTCEATCPVLYHATDLYVATLELFALSLILPLLCLPCIYLWILSRASGESDTLAQIQEELQASRNQPVTVQELMEVLEHVKLVGTSLEDARVVGLNSDNDDSKAAEANNATNPPKECCICMSDFPLTDEEMGLSSYQRETTEADTIVRTRCGHLFHKKCLGGWIGGRWASSEQPDTRRARRTCCPLCRQELKQ